MAHSYEDLIVWQKAMDLVTEVYRITKQFPRDERFGLSSQIRRAAVSVPSNIAEGKGRSNKDFVRFLLQARGSLWEVETQLHLSARLGYVAEEVSRAMRSQASEVGKMISGLITSIQPATAFASD